VQLMLARLKGCHRHKRSRAFQLHRQRAFSSVRPSATSIRDNTRRMGSSWAAIARTPARAPTRLQLRYCAQATKRRRGCL